MKIMVRLFDGWDWWDNVVEAEKDPEFGFDDYELVYEGAKYIPERWIDYETIEKLASEELGHHADFDEVMDYADNQEMLIYLDYNNKFVQLWVGDSRPVPPNSKLGPVQMEFPDRDRFRSMAPKMKHLFSR